MTTNTTTKSNDRGTKPSDVSVKPRDKIESLRLLVQELVHKVETLSISETTRTATLCFYEEVERYETELIRGALLRTGGNQKEAAKLLGILPTTLNAKIKRYNIELSSFRRLGWK